MEGHGSNGQIRDGLSLYGTSKRGINYLWQALAGECEMTKIKIGALSPGITVTDFILKNRAGEGEEKWPEDRMAHTNQGSLQIPHRCYHPQESPGIVRTPNTSFE